jgi:hypothetical protein
MHVCPQALCGVRLAIVLVAQVETVDATVT